MRDWRRISFYIFMVALPLALGSSYLLPYWLRVPGESVTIPAWTLKLTLWLGLVVIITTPGAWRWIYRRRD